MCVSTLKLAACHTEGKIKKKGASQAGIMNALGGLVYVIQMAEMNPIK